MFCRKNWKVREYYSMGAGERLVTRAFLSMELEIEDKQLKELSRR